MDTARRIKTDSLLKALRFAAFFVVILSGLVVIVGTGGSSSHHGDDSPATVNVDESYDGEQVTLGVDDLLMVTLGSNPTTGYAWAVSEISDELIIENISNEYIASEAQEGMVGVGGQEIWTFEALAAGTADISMGYIHPWEDPPVPADTFDITVNVE